ncbi:hypothetical protein BCR34DRAFT_268973 [Clohesyomyces aquaticus]|uniref:Uncharacterized protein n=1 Tax=Clohesyomyces aquaticus TaxID=1231657 RepID=A0A1Y1ZUG3_9PLEO|nr:hypothetical protein BCR34DRAFT_268973 [Clohesyomyces aquaticus]
MPASPSPQTPSGRVRPMKPADFGKAIGIDKPANIKDKIRKWQVDLDGEVSGAENAEPAAPAPVVVVKSKPSPKPQPTPKSKPVDFGKAIGIDKPANISYKIRKWQVDVGVDDSGSENAGASAPVDDVKPTPKSNPFDDRPNLRPTHTPAKSTEESPERPKSAKKPPTHNKLDDDLRIASAPKKRVVSDSHWRNKKSPPKDGATKPSPKPLPTAWVRPAVRRNDSSEPKATPPRPEPKPLLLFTTRPPGPSPRTKSARRRRQSRPTSSGNDERPTSSGSGSGKGAKSADEGLASPTSPALLNDKDVSGSRRRRRRRGGSSPKGSQSAEDATPTNRRKSRRKSDTPSVDDPPPEKRDEPESPPLEPSFESGNREKRRSHHRRERTLTSPDEMVGEPQSSGRRRSHRRSQQYDSEPELHVPAHEVPIPETPPQKHFGSRLEAWLSTTPDPFVDSDSRTRRASKESTSTLDLRHRKPDKKEVLESIEVNKVPVEDFPGRKSGGRRRTESRRVSIKVDTEVLTDKELSVPPTDVTESSFATSIANKDGEITPSPTLKRRGARRTHHSPTKERSISSPLRESTLPDDDNDVASSAPSSSVDPSSMTLEKVSLHPKASNALAMRRRFPSTGNRLSTIVSVETLATKAQATPDSEVDVPQDELTAERVEGVAEEDRTLDEIPASESGCLLNEETITTLSRGSTKQSGYQLNAETLTTLSRRSTKRRLASHADLISVLSMPQAGAKSIMSARSIRTNRSRLATATTGDIMNELASDETKYMRELRTLVDGVIPVLLSCVLSKSDSAVAAGLFSRSALKSDPSAVTKPIIDMGVSLERLKSLHRRIPKDEPDAFLSWAQSAQRIYSDYIGCWRMGFQDVVVSLATADEDSTVSGPAKLIKGPDDAGAWEEGLPQNAEGYVVNGEGERVDVAYMLKRPLVRLKYLAKSIKGINHVKPSEQAEKMSSAFQDLVDAARRRSNDEQARLEDEAASSIDPTRARDPRSLAPVTGVRIDPARCVRARDYFDMHLMHSSGQLVDCRVELLLRDNAPGTGSGGDLLLCEIDGTGRWLFLPPIQLSRISARNGDLKGEIVVMIRGYHSDGKEWSELLSLTTNDEQAGFEWVQMLGLNPIPPQLAELKRDPSLLNKTPRPTSSHASSSLVSAATGSTPPQKSRTPSPHEIEIPIGEQANATSKRWGYETPERLSKSPELSPVTPPSSDKLRIKHKRGSSPHSTTSTVETRLRAEDGLQVSTPTNASLYDDCHHERTPRTLDEAMVLAGSGSPVSLKRTRAKRLSKNPSPSSASCSRPSRQIVLADPPEEATTPRKRLSKRRSQPPASSASSVSQSSKAFSVWMPTSETEYSDNSDEDEQLVREAIPPPKRPEAHRRASSVPTLDLPTIGKIRKTSQPSTPIKESRLEAQLAIEERPSSAPAKLKKKMPEPVSKEPETLVGEDKPPPVPAHRSPSPASPVTLKGSNTPVFTPSLPGYKTRRRSSSPLKHEYEPSTATESSTESEEEISEDDSLTSDSSDDELEDDVPTPLMPITQMRQFPRVSPPSSIYTLPNGTITPSQSASNTPYRTVPKNSGQAAKCIASLFTWSNDSKWVSLHPDDCSIVVTPGKVEIFEITATHSKPFLADGDEIIQADGRAPLVAMELTPLVPMRQSNAIDITIRSPPTSESRLKSGNNILLRSRNTAECASLYNMLNESRKNNPTYLALQNARGPYGQSSWAEVMDRQNAARSNAGSSGGWFSGTLGRRSSYRKSSTRAASISAATESSVGTMNTALKSALGRFSFGARGRFSIRDSTISSRNSLDSGSTGSGAITPPTGKAGRAPGAPAGITNTKCRLYERESFTTKWRDMGAARLNIMLPDPSTLQSTMRQGQGSPGVRNPMLEKRIVVVGKSKGQTLLDVTLGETSFERVARTGIAVSVWEDVVGPNGQIGTVGAVGGVSGAKARIYMIQMKSEREAAYSFSLLGKYKY